MSEPEVVAYEMRPYDRYYAGWILAMSRSPRVTAERMREVIADAKVRIARYQLTHTN
ncbi:Uncharacterised protein [Mycobacteroides abscessus subsp. massiliense]|nr:Uncharacterised protein [Mycobacteroides abscessus subsp. massiliense]SLI31727.1 Uncharacterised protein [Mycobacteroides abscessus subsp. massiliense]